MGVTITSLASEGFRQSITAGHHTFFADLSKEKGGQDTAADPHQLLFASWGACTNMTVQLYCRRKGWPLREVTTSFREEKQGSHSTIYKSIEVVGNLDEAQLSRIKQIAEKCPVNQLIVGTKQIHSELIHKDGE